MKKYILCFTMLFSFLGSFVITSYASERVIKPVFINRCGELLNQLYISKVDENNWNVSLIDNIIDLGESKRVSFKPDDGTSRWDIMARDKHGREIIWKNVDLCAGKKFILHYKNGRSWITRYGEDNSPVQSN